MELIFNLFSFDINKKKCMSGLDLCLIQLPTAILCFDNVFNAPMLLNIVEKRVPQGQGISL